jgi:hypothetical protein
MSHNRRAASLAMIAALWLTGCQAVSHHAGAGGGPQDRGAGPRVDGVRAVEYTSLAELAKDSSGVVVATAGTQQQSTVHGVPFTTTAMTGARTVSGTVPHTFRLYQIGANDGSAPDDMVVASPGKTYLLFVTPFESAPGVVVAPDLFTTVGAAAGMYQQGLSGFAKTDPISPLLPAAVSAASAQSAFNASH